MFEGGADSTNTVELKSIGAFVSDAVQDVGVLLGGSDHQQGRPSTGKECPDTSTGAAAAAHRENCGRALEGGAGVREPPTS